MHYAIYQITENWSLPFSQNSMATFQFNWDTCNKMFSGPIDKPHFELLCWSLSCKMSTHSIHKSMKHNVKLFDWFGGEREVYEGWILMLWILICNCCLACWKI